MGQEYSPHLFVIWKQNQHIVIQFDIVRQTNGWKLLFQDVIKELVSHLSYLFSFLYPHKSKISLTSLNCPFPVHYIFFSGQNNSSLRQSVIRALAPAVSCVLSSVNTINTVIWSFHFRVFIQKSKSISLS